MGLGISTGDSEARPGRRATALSLRILSKQKPKQSETLSSLTSPVLAWGGRSLVQFYLSSSERHWQLGWSPPHSVQSSSVNDEWGNPTPSWRPTTFLGGNGITSLVSVKKIQNASGARCFIKSTVNIKEIQAKENWEMALKNDPSAFFTLGQLTMGLCLWEISVTSTLFFLVWY